MNGQDVKNLRLKLNLSQREFAEEFHFTDQGHVSKVERGEIPITDLREAYMKLWIQTHRINF